MSDATASKKRKVVGVEATEAQSKIYIEGCVEDISIMTGKKEFIREAKKDASLVGRLFEACYIPDVSAPGVRVMPTLPNCSKKRDEQGVITKIKFEDNTKLSGVSLKRLAGAYAYGRKGYDAMVWAEKEKACLAALVLPECDMEKESRKHPTQGKDDLEVLRFHFSGSVCKLFVPVKDFITVISVPEVQVQHMKDILVAMNQIAKSDPDASFPKPTLPGIVSPPEEMKSSRLWSAYNQVLLGVFMQEASLDDRIKAFLKHGPSLILAGSLNILKPEQQKMVGEDLKYLARVKLSELDDSDELLCSDMPLPANLYTSIKINTCYVYPKPDGAYGRKVGNRLRAMENGKTMTAGQLRGIIQAIVTSRAKETVDDAPKRGVDQSSDEEDDTEENVF
jgi:hypothetical protein